MDFLALFDRVSLFINDRHDVRSSDLTTLIVTIFQNGGKLSNHRRKQFAQRVPLQALDAIETGVSRAMRGLPLDQASRSTLNS
ncbi:hypothetical protein [Pulveribacter suum]|uniref:Uncharacterized protein n=1 Tax=Pulveribacter suum TaxID=2116657 RepID=A0A2P1NHA0_9BURK|nr:hypothetical protein [Pulveribacter suum]AVP56424.1 hypothetical protein C7H73_01210 [Pulveribacter suum]